MLTPVSCSPCPTRVFSQFVTRAFVWVFKVSSPIWLSTTSDGRRVAGLAGLPKLPGEVGLPVGTAPPVLFIGNHQLYGFLDLPLMVEEVLVGR